MTWLANQFARDGWIDHWQPLLAGSIAVVAALVGGAFILKQIRATRNSEIEARRRRLEAARAVLPLNLSGLTDYALQCNRILKAVYDTRVDERVPEQDTPPELPSLPAGVIEDLREIIEHADEPLRTSVRKLLTTLQVQIARMRSLLTYLKKGFDDNHLILVANVETCMVDAAETYARCGALFEYARGNSDAAPGAPMRGDIYLALRQTGIWDEAYPRVHQLVMRYYDR